MVGPSATCVRAHNADNLAKGGGGGGLGEQTVVFMMLDAISLA